MAEKVRQSCGDAEEKSREFLVDILGEELSKKFFKDGYIEIESGGNLYQLYENGRIINKTSNHAYCIVPTRHDLPIYDVIAIKYAWLKYGLKTVEKVANKTSLTYKPRTDAEGRRIDGVGYDAFIHYMEQQGWRREQVIIREDNTNLVSTYFLSNGYPGAIAEIKCPTGCMMTTMGLYQIPQGGDLLSAYTVSLYVTDKHGKEINYHTKIRIEKIKVSEEVIQLARIFYADINITKFGGDHKNNNDNNNDNNILQKKRHDELFRWRSGVALYGGEYLRFLAINPETDIHSYNVNIGIDFDIWTRDM